MPAIALHCGLFALNSNGIYFFVFGRFTAANTNWKNVSGTAEFSLQTKNKNDQCYKYLVHAKSGQFKNILTVLVFAKAALYTFGRLNPLIRPECELLASLEKKNSKKHF